MKRLKVSKNDVDIHIAANVNSIDGKITEAVVLYGGELDYNKLKNKPSINGKELIGNINEADPLVPEWAKEPEQPSQPVPPSEVEKWLNGETTSEEEEP